MSNYILFGALSLGIPTLIVSIFISIHLARGAQERLYYEFSHEDMPFLTIYFLVIVGCTGLIISMPIGAFIGWLIELCVK